MKIAVIIPTYNESDTIEFAVKTLNKVFQKIGSSAAEMHILVVDGNSPDGTANIVRGLIKKYKNVHLLAKEKKGGLGADYADAMAYSFDKMNCDAVITFDADVSHDPEKLPVFVEKLERGADFVIGTRYRKGGGMPDDWALHRKFLSYFGNLFIRLMYFGSGVSDFTSGFKGFPRATYRRIKDWLEGYAGYTFSIAANLSPLREGFSIEEVPYKFKDRTAGKSKLGAEYFKNALIYVIKTRILDFLNSRFGRVFLAGGMGAVSQLIMYGVFFYPIIEAGNVFNLQEKVLFYDFRFFPRFIVSQLFSIEVGIFTSFTINNLWAFADKKLSGLMFWRRYVKNHFVVMGAILIQLAIGQILAAIFGSNLILNYLYQIAGILVGLIWNFYFYKRIIWKVGAA